MTVISHDEAADYPAIDVLCPDLPKIPGCISVFFITAGCHLPDPDFLAHAQHWSDILQLTQPFRLELQNHRRMAVISSQEPPVLLHCPTDGLPVVVSARQGKGFLAIELDGVTPVTTVVMHVKSATHGIRVHVGKHISKAGLLAKHQRFRVRVSERVYVVSAYNDRWRSYLAAVEPFLCARYLCTQPAAITPLSLDYAYAYMSLQSVDMCAALSKLVKLNSAMSTVTDLHLCDSAATISHLTLLLTAF